MHVILLERVAKLGNLGETVRVRDGFARNFLLPQGKALRATKENMSKFERERSSLEERNAERRRDADQVKTSLDQRSFVVVRQAAETGQLYGSVSSRDICDILAEAGYTVGRSQVSLNFPLKEIGLHNVEIFLHPEVTATITLNIARSEDEANRQARGEDMTAGAREETFVREVGSVMDEEGGDEEA
ncbi:50S ribosomal protein L9 [Mongoliimonas terrestris]|uniref:50S ribosomal protein L9 n=1 Tax=Mongoliimonas terrestris TaxID=1709001 RepID=UPI0009499256|nr:50S ribosomal protein L9 [Mongoliimonas terrestris]